MKQQLGLNEEDSSKLGVIINTCMNPWYKSQKTYRRMSFIIRNELYNAYGAVSTLKLLRNEGGLKLPQYLRFTLNVLIFLRRAPE